VQFGGLSALSDFSLSLDAGELAGLIGPNGAGKTTVFNAITGVYPTCAGSIALDGRRIDGLTPYQVAGLGVARTFQTTRLFRALTVLENLGIALAARCRPRCGLLTAVVGGRRSRDAEASVVRGAMELLETFNLADRADDVAGGLPYGLQRRLEIVRALAIDPKILLLDEPAAGLNPAETTELMELIGGLPGRFGVAVLLIEHDMRLVTSICHRVSVLNYGRQIAAGDPRSVIRDPAVIQAYLGEPTH